MAEFIGKDGDGVEKHFIQYDGLNYPKGVVEMMENKCFETQLKCCRDLDVLDNDVFIAAYVKSGMHWSWEIVTMLVNGTTEYSKKHKEGSMLDFQTPKTIAELPSPRVLNLHFPLRYFPQQAIEKRCKIIRIMRNPKDVFVSYFNHCNTIPVYEKVNSFSSFLPMMLGENGFYLKQAWFEYELEWEKFAKDNPTYPILILYYEDLKEDLKKWVGRIAEFLEVDASESTLHAISTKCDIKQHRQGFIDSKEDGRVKTFKVGDKPLMFRKGIVGDWKNWFTVAENERMDAWISKHLVDTDLKFRYTL